MYVVVYPLNLISSVDSNQKKQSFYRWKNCIKRFCSDIKALGTKIVNYEQKEMIPLTDNGNKYYEEQKEYYVCQKEFCCDENQKMKFKLSKKVRDHCHCTGKFRGTPHSICNLNCKVPQKIRIKTHNGSKYDYHFINFVIFNCLLTVTLHKVAYMLFIIETRKKYLKEILDCL